MLVIDCAVLIVLVILAVLSRQHFSKYKGRVWWLFLAMGETIYNQIKPIISLNQMEKEYRKLQVLSDQQTKQYVQKTCILLIAGSLGILFLCATLSGVAVLNEKKKDTKECQILREDYVGNIKKQEIYLLENGKEQCYELAVYPQRYTETEFEKMATQIFEELPKQILGANKDLAHITSNLTLPEQDETGLVALNWRSFAPQYLSSYGVLQTDMLTTDCTIGLMVEATYEEYTATYEYELTLRTHVENAEKSNMELAKESLRHLEEENRTKKELVLPEQIGTIEISLEKGKELAGAWFYLAGLFAIGGMIAHSYSKRKEERKKRDDELIKCYAPFVNKLWLFLGTGMTVKKALEQFCREASSMQEFLKLEIEYTLHEIEHGFDESASYEQLGIRLDLANYMRLMSHISQNLRLGSRDLLSLMEEEVRSATELRREYAKKKGEEASTKLLLPMGIMLLLVMVIIVFPAMISF